MGEGKVGNGGNSLEEGQSFDCESKLTEGPKSSDSFDVKGLQPTALGKFLDTMPLPALLIDPYSRIAFANRSCTRISPQPEKLHGLSLSKLFAGESAVAQIQRLTKEVFSTGKSQVIDSTFEISGQRMRSRLYLQAMMFGNNKWMVLLMKDLTEE